MCLRRPTRLIRRAEAARAAPRARRARRRAHKLTVTLRGGPAAAAAFRTTPLVRTPWLAAIWETLA